MVKHLQFCAATGLVLLIAACGAPPDSVEITDTATRSEYRYEDKVDASSNERFLSRAALARLEAKSPFHYSVPAGWTELTPTEFRNPNFVIGQDGDTECYISVLQGDGGGLAINLNRWRGQFNAPDYTQEEIEALPSVQILGYPAKVVNFSGDFKGMGQTEAQPDYRLIGAIIQADGRLITIKMTGPESKVMPQLNHFATFIDSLHENTGDHDHAPVAAAPIADDATMPADHPPLPQTTTASQATPAPNGAGDYMWEVPEGWTLAAGASSMRLVTFNVRDDETGAQAECYITVLGGDGGGRLNNYNRWLGQFGQEPLDETELMLQPPVIFFNEEVPMLVIEGDYGGMSGEKKPNQMLVGTSQEVNGQTLFIKLVGPKDAVRANWSKFVVFCSSIDLKE
ncbi:MAG: hypothetical protein VCD00_02995 [Candidatus Hydrogenedentota bacterium]